MKNINYLLFLIPVLLFACNSVTKEEKQNASAYAYKLHEQKVQVTDKLNQVIASSTDAMAYNLQGRLSANKIEKLNNELKNLRILTEQVLDSVQELEEFDDKIRYKEALIKYMEVCIETLDNEFQSLVESLSKEMTPENLLKSGKLVITITETFLDIEKEIREVQKEFAKKYKLEIGKDPKEWKTTEQQIKEFKKEIDAFEKEMQ